MKAMKKIFFCVVIMLTAQIISGQHYYDTLLRAVILAERDEAGQAANLLGDLREIDTDASLLALRGDIYLKAGMTGAARSDFMKAENLSQGAGLHGLARCAAAGGDVKTAVSLLESHLKSSSRKPEPEILLDEIFGKISATPEWRSLWKKDWYRIDERKSWEIDHYLKAGRSDQAAAAYAELSALYPGMPVTEYCNARILMDQERYGEASAILADLASADDASPEWIMALAAAREGEGNHYAAAAQYDRLIRSHYPDPDLLLMRSRMLLRSGDREAAKREMQRYYSIDPDNTEALGLIGKTYAEEGAIYEALPYLNENVEKHPGEPSAFSLRGDAWLAARTWDRAAEDYAMSLDLDPENGQVNLSLGIALINDGRSDDACYYLRRARSLGIREANGYLAQHCLK
jgi:predicted Zn-dependent protease